ncbi:MAG: hypothetical protein Q7K26_03125 [bacterium]|nr:hypothetical protein [bacterium]
MPQMRFIGALVVSVALIGGALWFRFVRIPPYSAEVVAVSQVESISSDEAEVLTDFFSTATSSPTTSATTLSQTDLIGRQLFTDYMALKSQGETTPSNIDALAGNLAESIKNVDISIPKINQKQVIVVLESEVSLATYSNMITNLRSKYKNLVAAQTGNSGGDIADTNSRTFSTFMSAVGKLYKAAASELLVIGVPTSLAQNHLNLINHYLETAEVMKLISNTSEDPIKAYAALNIYAQNGGREAELLLNIQKTMLAHGIIFNSSI